MTDTQKLLFFRLLAEGKLNVQQYDPEEIYDQQQWEIQEIGQNSFGKKYWKRAGAFRNQQMADYADALIAITNGSSGTADMIERAKKKGLTIFIKELK